MIEYGVDVLANIMQSILSDQLNEGQFDFERV